MENLNLVELPISHKLSTLKMALLSAVTLGIYPIVWVFQHREDINSLSAEKPIGFSWVIALSVLFLLSTIIAFSNSPESAGASRGVVQIMAILYLVLSFKMLKKLENFAKDKYNKTIKHNGLGWFLFNIFYVNHALNSFATRVVKAK